LHFLLHQESQNIYADGNGCSSVQPNSLSIWTHGLKNIQWFESSFTPTGCNFSINGPAVSVGAGNQWDEIYAAAKAKDPTLGIVGGAFGSVSVGGYISNGGHGVLSAKYGLGADMVLQIELVTASGETITANECQNQDYFWAMRGVSIRTMGSSILLAATNLVVYREEVLRTV
jgi:FAD/FMN-containing dehydrogenase